jgi:N utilization substance protein B
MQSLFILKKDDDMVKKDALDFFERAINDSFEIYLFNLYCIIGICEFSLADKGLRNSKHLPTDEDKSFSAKIYENELIQNLVNNSKLQKAFDKYAFAQKMDKDHLKRIYKKIAAETVYKKYLLNSPEEGGHLEILHEIYRNCRRDEVFNEVIEDHYPTWADDKSLIVGAVKKTLKELPSGESFYLAYYPDSETVDEFGKDLLLKVLADEEYLMSLIDPVLENWDSDRVALVDMLFIKMALCEFLNFVTIPTKVTLNEYVDLSKDYSTEKSKDFINGVLDRIMRIMKEEGLIKKEGRGLLA